MGYCTLGGSLLPSGILYNSEFGEGYGVPIKNCLYPPYTPQKSAAMVGHSNMDAAHSRSVVRPAPQLLACLFVLVTACLFVLATHTFDRDDDVEQSCGSYTLVQSRRSWSDAREYCQSRGGDLASMSDVSEWRALAGCYPEVAGVFYGVYFPNNEVWLAGYSQRGMGSSWRWASDGEAFWRNGSIGRFNCWRHANSIAGQAPMQHDDSIPFNARNHYTPPPGDVDLCLRASLPVPWAPPIDHDQCLLGRWWADVCERRLIFLCQSGNWPPRAPSPPLAPPQPPLTPWPPLPPPWPPIAPIFRGEGFARCCHDFDELSPCCACNGYCRETALIVTSVLLAAMLPTWLLVLANCACQRQQPPHGAATELTAWPAVPIGKWQFATFQVGIVLTVAGLIPAVLYGAGDRWPLGNTHRTLSLTLLGIDIVFLAIRPTTREARIVIFASATLLAVLLIVGMTYAAEAVRGVSRASGGHREWPQVVADLLLSVLLLCLALPLARNLRPCDRRWCSHLSMGAVAKRLNRLWFAWRTANLFIGLSLFTVFTLSCVRPSISDALLPRDPFDKLNERVFLAFTSGLGFLGAWLPTAQRRFRLSLLWLPRNRKQLDVSLGRMTAKELFRTDVPHPVASADWPESPPGLAAALSIGDQPEVLGRGGFCVVYAAQLEGKPVAIKQLRILHPHKEAVRLFRREVDLLTTIDCHPHLCKCLGACLVLGLPAIVLERYEGGSLDGALCLHRDPSAAAATAATAAATVAAAATDAADPYGVAAVSEALRSFETRWQLAHQLARGLEHLHALQVHHRDIKPENVLLDRSHRHAVLSDFGSSRRTSALSEASNQPMSGSMRYMAPEVLLERYEYASDVYAFALLMWTLAYGSLCFSQFTAFQVMFHVHSNPATFRPVLSAPPALDLSGAAEVPEHIWEPTKGLIQRCWHVEATRRPTMVDVVALLQDATPAAKSTAASPTPAPTPVPSRALENWTV